MSLGQTLTIPFDGNATASFRLVSFAGQTSRYYYEKSDGSYIAYLDINHNVQKSGAESHLAKMTLSRKVTGADGKVSYVDSTAHEVLLEKPGYGSDNLICHKALSAFLTDQVVGYLLNGEA